MKTTFERLQAIVAKDYKLENDKATPDALLESLGIDSIGVAELLFNIEDEFHVNLPVEPVHGLSTLGDVARFIDGLIGAARTGVPAGRPGPEGESPPAP
jgi:acyl carrier protein